MSIISNIPLGISADLTKGFRADWKLTDPTHHPLFLSSKTAVEPQPAQISQPTSPTPWSYPYLSLHEDADSLLSEIFPYQLADSSSSISSGILLSRDLNRQEVLQQYSSQLGINLTDPDSRFVLVKLIKQAGSSGYPYESGTLFKGCEGTPANPYKKKTLKLFAHNQKQENQGNFTENEAREYLEMFHEYGTHYISQVDFGDVLFQVFAYSLERFEKIKKVYSNGKNPMSGPGAVAFNYYTTNTSGSRYGYVKEYGHILSLSDSSCLTEDLSAGKWNDGTWSRTDSIFSVFEGGTMPFSCLDQRYTDCVPIKYSLRSLSVFHDSISAQKMDNLWRAVLCTKYQDLACVAFPNDEYERYKALVSNLDSHLISAISTPTINVYKEFLDWDNITLAAPELVKEFSLYTNILAASSDENISLPGDSVKIAAQMVNCSPGQCPKKLILTDAAFDTFSFCCCEFWGALRIVNESHSKEKLIVNGILFERTEEDGRLVIHITSDIRRPLDADNLADFEESLSCSFLFSQQILRSSQHGGSSLQNFTVPGQKSDSLSDTSLQKSFALKNLGWIVESVPEISSLTGYKDSLKLAQLKVMSHAIIKSSAATKPKGVFVPVLPYEKYKEHADQMVKQIGYITDTIHTYQSQLETRRLQEQMQDLGTALNENIIQTGTLIADAIDAFSQNQNDLSTHYDSLITDLTTENATYEKQIEDVQAELKTRSQTLQNSVNNLRDLCGAYMERQLVDCALSIATNLFNGFASIALPSSEYKNLAAIGATYQKAQKIFNILNAFDTALSKGTKDIAQFILAEKAYMEADDTNVEEITDTDWDEMEININHMIGLAPSDTTIDIAKQEVSRDLKLLLIKGRQLIKLRLLVHQNQQQIALWFQQQTIAKAQKNRLDALKSHLHPKEIKDLDVNQIDLVGMTGVLENTKRQMLGMLSNTFWYMDAALQYQTLQPATQTGELDLLSFSSAISMQLGNKNAAETQMNRCQKTTTVPIPITIQGIPVSSLTDGRQYSFTIPLDQPEFLKYINLRVKSVIAQIDHVKSTDSGQYLLQLDYDGSAFYDRDFHRSPVCYNTLDRQRIYEYEAGSNRPLFSDNGTSWSDGVNAVTPFATWKVSLPKTATNLDLKFSSAFTCVRLLFVLDARIKDAPELHPKNNGRMLRSGSNSNTKEALIQTMSKTEINVLKGWDVVLNMDLSSINDSLKKQYDALMANTSETYFNTIDVTTRSKSGKSSYMLKRFVFQFGYPKMSFFDNNDRDVSLRMNISNGTIYYGSENSQGEQTWDEDTDTFNNTTLLASVPVSGVKGKTTSGADALDAVITLSQGSFSLENMELDPEEVLDVCKAIKGFFTQNDITYLINRLDLTQHAVTAALRPNAFGFRMLKPSEGKQILQVFIQTGSHEMLDRSLMGLNVVTDPIPDDSKVSLMISNQILFEDLLPSAFNGAVSWNMAGVAPENGKYDWSAKTSAGTLEVEDLDLSSMSWRDFHVFGTAEYDHSYEVKDGKIDISTANISLCRYPSDPAQSPSDMKEKDHIGYLNFRLKNENEEHTFVHIRSRFGKEVKRKDFQKSFTIEVNAPIGMLLSGTGRNQSVSIDTSRFSSTAIIDTGIKIDTGCGVGDLDSKFAQLVQTNLPGKVESSFASISFPDISIFALQNLLFPCRQYITFTAVSTPGDLLLIGDFAEEPE